jgi:hypothetical protein
MMPIVLKDQFAAIEKYKGESLTKNISSFEKEIIGLSSKEVDDYCSSTGIDNNLFESALSIKKLSSQIDVIIHSSGILRSLPRVLRKGEIVESVSLGAGNTGKKFDLETNFRIAEYKFIDWKGGPEAIRQNGIFKDFFELAEYETHKEKYLYVVGTSIPMKFFHGGRALTSVLSRYPKILNKIIEKYGSDVVRVMDYYKIMQDEVCVEDIAPTIGRGA